MNSAAASPPSLPPSLSLLQPITLSLFSRRLLSLLHVVSQLSRCSSVVSKMACEELQRGETVATLKRESDNLKKKLEQERSKLNDVECK